LMAAARQMRHQWIANECAWKNCRALTLKTPKH
jgi:hypothetical protein